MEEQLPVILEYTPRPSKNEVEGILEKGVLVSLGKFIEVDYLCLYRITFGNFQLSTSSVKISLSEYSKKCFF